MSHENRFDPLPEAGAGSHAAEPQPWGTLEPADSTPADPLTRGPEPSIDNPLADFSEQVGALFG